MSVVPRARRLDLVAEYYFSRKLKEVAALRESGRDVISLGVGSPDLPPHPSVARALSAAAAADDTHGYQPYSGVPRLRAAMAVWYQRTYGVRLDPAKEVLPLMGSKEGILHITMAFANPGDAVLVPDPGYATYAGVAKLLGVDAVRYDLTEEGGWAPDLASIERGGDVGRARIMWINYPHMPTGASAAPGLFARLVAWCKAHRILLVNDNPYSLVLPNRPPESLLSTPGAREVALELNSLSKSHNMPGWRVGCVVGDAAYVSSVLQVKSNFDSGMFLGLQDAAAAALTEVPESWHVARNEEYARRRGVCHDILRALGCSFLPGQVGMFVWARAPAEWASVEGRLDNLLYGCGVFATPGQVFGTNGARYVRLSLCCPLPRLQEALQRIRGHVAAGRFGDKPEKQASL